MHTIVVAAVAMFMAGTAAAQTLYPPMPCSYYAQSAYGYAVERDRGFTKESRLAELDRPPADNKTAIAIERQMIEDLWTRRDVTPDQALSWAHGWCGWRALPRR